MGTAAPCSTGFARTGVLRLGNRWGKIEWSAVPIVCVWVCGVPADTEPETRDEERRVDWLICCWDCVADNVGGMGDWTTLRKGEFESQSGFGGRGRKRRTGRLRRGWWEFSGKRMFIIRWKEGRSTLPG